MWFYLYLENNPVKWLNELFVHFVQCSNRYYSSVSEEAMRLFLSLFLSPCVGFWASAGTYTVIIYTQREQLPLLRKKHLDLSFTPSLHLLLLFFLSCWHPSILSAVLSLQFFVSVFYSFSFVFFFLSVIHLCPLPSPSRNIKKQVCENISSMPYSQWKCYLHVGNMVKFDISKATS